MWNSSIRIFGAAPELRSAGIWPFRTMRWSWDILAVSFGKKVLSDLAIAWRKLRIIFPNAYLLLCGSAEKKDPVRPELLSELQACARVRRLVAVIDEMPGYFSATDVCVLPSYREGLLMWHSNRPQ